jgi:hypothetical protein
MEKLVDTFIEVSLKHDEDFLKVKETLTRIGVASRRENKLFQSCHILHKQGKYYIVHFKEMFALDGKDTDFSDEDKGRRNRIALLLQEWGLLTVLHPERCEEPLAAMNMIKVLSFKEKKDWICEPKYNLGRKRS